MLDKSQPQNMREKMDTVFAEIESLAAKKEYLDYKIKLITNAGVDEVASVGTPNNSSLALSVLDMDEARAREELRRSMYREETASIASSSDTRSEMNSVPMAAQQQAMLGQGSQSTPTSPQVDRRGHAIGNMIACMYYLRIPTNG